MVNNPQSEPAPGAKQLVFLAIMATVVAVIVFLCGVLVGRGVPVTRTEAAAADDDDVLRRGRAQRGVDTSPLPGDADDDASSLLEGLSYFERLNGPAPGGEAASVPLAPEAGAEDRIDDSNRAEAVEVSQAAAARVPLPAVDTVPTAVEPGPGGGMFMVQVTALQRSAEANQVAAGLVARGYPAFVVAPEAEAPGTLFRVRVGPYADRAAAETARRRLETEQQFKPWVIQS